MFKTHFRQMVIATVLMGSLGGCAVGVIGGATALASVADRRSAGSQADDQIMELQIKAKAGSMLRKNNTSNFKPSLSVVSYNRLVLLLGVVASEADRQMAAQIARAERSAQAVYNHITVVDSGRTLTNISNDTLITSRVRTSLLNLDGVYPGHVKVVTFNGITYVMGLLTPTQQELVNQRISTTSGVQRVVTLYENYVEPVTN